MALTEFGRPVVPVELPVPAVEGGGLLVRVAAAGICGSDLEIARGRDPRVSPELLPMVLGHEGCGWVEEMGGERTDLQGRPVAPGDLVVWNRGATCGRCYQCAVKHRPALCEAREVYGISLGARAPFWLNGCWAEQVYVRPACEVIVLPATVDPTAVVAVTCSGATAAHAAELSGQAVGDRVLVLGPGPLGLYAAAFAFARGAAEVVMAGTERSRSRLALAAAMGCTSVMSAAQPQWLGAGFDVVVDAAGTGASVTQALAAVRAGGTVVLPGVASPIGTTAVDVYEQVARKQVRMQGVWVSDAGHLHQAVALLLSGRYGLDRLTTHRFSLGEANAALAAVESREAVKAVLVP